MCARRGNRIARSASSPISATTGPRPCLRRWSPPAPRLRRRCRGGAEPLVRRPPAQARNKLAFGLRLDVAGKLTAGFDFELPVTNRAGYPAGSANEEPSADRQRALETAMHLGRVDRSRALEQAALGDIDLAAVLQIGLDAALDDKLIA